MYQLCRYTRRTPLDTTPPIKYGDVIHPGDKRLSPGTRARFLESGTLVLIELPPLSVLPESWQERAELLAGVDIVTIGDLLAVDERELAKVFKSLIDKAATAGEDMELTTQELELINLAKKVTPRLIRQWKTEAEEWLKPEQPTPTND